MAFNVKVSEAYPCWIEISTDDGMSSLQLSHRELLQLEHAVAEAKRQVLTKLPRREWHEVDSKIIGIGQ